MEKERSYCVCTGGFVLPVEKAETEKKHRETQTGNRMIAYAERVGRKEREDGI